jgi:predicted nucleotidyltransferase
VSQPEAVTGGARAHSFSRGRYDGRTLRDWLPEVVDRVVATIDPLEVIVFGSIARGDEGPDSDIDLLVVLDDVEPRDKASIVTTIYRGLRCGVPVDVVVADSAEVARDRQRVGSVLLPALRDGRSVYRRA